MAVSTRHILVILNPDSGWNVWGQASAIRELQRAVQTTPAHAYLFSGPANSGKRLAAVNFAMALCCASPPEPGRYCGECGACRRIGRGVYPDVTVYDLASQAERDREKSRNHTLNIQTVREVSSAVAFRPAESRWRIAIVDDAETMQETAQEAFLKTLEEPPSYAVIILIASDAERLLDTVRSRCTNIRFGLATTRVVAEALRAHGAYAGDVETIAALSSGSIGWAFRAIEDPALLEHRSLVVRQAMELVTADAYQRMVHAVKLADGFAADRAGVRERLQAVQEIWREAMYVQAGVHESPVSETITEHLGDIPLGPIVEAVDSVEKCLDNLEANVRPRLAMETMVSNWPTVES
jgi:DNA polymerase III subunit delta'